MSCTVYVETPKLSLYKMLSVGILTPGENHLGSLISPLEAFYIWENEKILQTSKRL